MRRSSWVFVLVLAGACNVKSSFSGSSTTPSGGTSTATSSPNSSPSSEGGGSTTSSNERAPMISLMGKTPDEARAALRAAGFSGDIEVNRHALVCTGAAEVPGQINCQSPDVGQLAYRRHSVNVTVYETPRHDGRLIRPQLEKVVGMLVVDAQKYMKSIGHTGELLVYEDPHTFYKGCEKDRVCAVQPEMGTGTGDRVTLFINKKSVEITLPD